jgi:membrane protein DedA with SNARE-associated domain
LPKRSTLLWALVAFFGASLAFSLVQDVTEDESTAVTLLAEIAVLAIIVAVIVLLVRRSERRSGDA